MGVSSVNHAEPLRMVQRTASKESGSSQPSRPDLGLAGKWCSIRSNHEPNVSDGRGQPFLCGLGIG